MVFFIILKKSFLLFYLYLVELFVLVRFGDRYICFFFYKLLFLNRLEKEGLFYRDIKDVRSYKNE